MVYRVLVYIILFLLIIVPGKTFAELPTQWYFGYDGSDPNTMGLWKCNEGTGSWAYNVVSGSDGLLQYNTIWDTGFSGTGNCVTLDGTQDNIYIAPYSGIVFQNQSFTIECWMKPASNADETHGWMFVYSKDGAQLIEYDPRTNELYFHLYNGGLDSALNYIVPGQVNGVWTHIACTYEHASGRQSLWINGLEVANKTADNSIFDMYTYPARVGCYSRNPNLYAFFGEIDELRISNVARSFAPVTNTSIPVSVSLANSGVALHWAAEYGSFYDVEWKDELCGIWQPLGLDLASHTGTVSFIDTGDIQENRLNPLEVSKRFYRVAKDHVPPPYTPLTVSQAPNQVSVNTIGRIYTFGENPFPLGIESKNVQMLKAPIRIIATANGQTISMEPGSVQVLYSTDEHIALQQNATSTLLDLTVHTEVEYDGLIQVDWTLTPSQSLTLQELTFEIPVKSEVAKYHHYYNDYAGKYRITGDIPPSGVQMGFDPMVWVGDEERGLQWFTESNRHWYNQNPDQCVQIVPDGDTVFMRFKLVSKDMTLSPTGPLSSLDYSFGLMAYPIKPIEQDCWDFRTFNMIQGVTSFGVEQESADGESELAYPAYSNFNLDTGTMELWVQPQFDPNDTAAIDHELFRTELWSGQQIVWKWDKNIRGMRFYVKESGIYKVDVSAPCAWELGEWYHIAVSWGDAIRLYHNGQEFVSQSFNGTTSGGLAGVTLNFGTQNRYQKCQFVLDEFRVSDTARSNTEIAESALSSVPFEADTHTLLLDHFDKPNNPGLRNYLEVGAVATVPAIGREGLVTGVAHTVTGKYNCGLRLGFNGSKLDYLCDLGVKTVMMAEHWNGMEGGLTTEYVDELHSLIDACHSNDMQFLPYFGAWVSDIMPEFTQCGDNWRMLINFPYFTNGRDLIGYPEMPDQVYYPTCYCSQWQDAFVDAVSNMLDEFDIDGIYFDGTTSFQAACYNDDHGCGTVLPAGNDSPLTWYFPAESTKVDSYLSPEGRAATFCLGEMRNTFKRVYTAVKTRKPDGQVQVHPISYWNPAIGYATSILEGENLSADSTTYPIENGPLDMIRSAVMGYQWGQPLDFIYYTLFSQYSNIPAHKYAHAVSMLHDVPVRCFFFEQVELESNLWRIRVEFNVKEAEWYPYWNNAQYVVVDPVGTYGAYASFHKHPTNGILMVVSNLNETSELISVQLNLANLDLGASPLAIDAMTEDPVTITNGQFQLSLNSLSWKYIWIQP